MVTDSFVGVRSPYLVGNERYPNLTNYLKVMDIVIRIVFMIGFIFLIVGCIIYVGLGLFVIVSAVINWEGNLLETIFMGVLTILGGILGGLINYLILIWCRLVALASLEMIRVFMDNEANTRKALGK